MSVTNSGQTNRSSSRRISISGLLSVIRSFLLYGFSAVQDGKSKGEHCPVPEVEKLAIVAVAIVAVVVIRAGRIDGFAERDVDARADGLPCFWNPMLHLC